MKKIINGRKYDTETAKNVGFWWNYLGRNDFGHCSETLYRKKNGEFFLYGEGGPMTGYAHECGDNSWCGGEKIIPYSENEAKEWAEKNLEVDEYEAIFGEVAE